MISTKALSKSATFSGLLVLLLTCVACSDRSLNNPNSGYGSAPNTTSSPQIASSPSTSPAASAIATVAQNHWSAIAQGDLTQVMSQYAESPTLQWVGGPLAGTYQGKDKIQAVWQKFIKAQAPLKTAITNVKNTTGAQGTNSVKALVTFSNAKTKIPVEYTLVYKSVAGKDRITEETWKIVKP